MEFFYALEYFYFSYLRECGELHLCDVVQSAEDSAAFLKCRTDFQIFSRHSMSYSPFLLDNRMLCSHLRVLRNTAKKIQ